MKSVDAFQDIRKNYNNVNLFSHIYRCLNSPSYRIIWLFRVLGGGNSLISKLLSLYYHRYSRKYLIELEPETRIGAGIHFPHNGPIVINPKTKIGENCIIHPCVLLGGDRKTGAPVIGNNVFIGHGCKLIGKVVIGDYVFIAPGAIVTKDVYSDYIIGAGINNIIRTTGGRQEVERYSIKL